MPTKSPALIGVVMGSQSDWAVMTHTAKTLKDLKIPHEVKIVSAHRTPKRMAEYATTAVERGLQAIIAGAGGAAHLPGMIAAQTRLPVFGVPIPSKALNGLDSLLSIVQMPKGVAVGTLAVGEAGAINAALIVAGQLATRDPALAKRLDQWRAKQTQAVPAKPK